MSTLRIHVGATLEDMKTRVVDAVNRARRGIEVAEDHVAFESWEALSAVMTAKRLELIRLLHRAPHASVADLARSLGRDDRSVQADVEALATAGLVSWDNGRLTIPYDEIRARIAV